MPVLHLLRARDDAPSEGMSLTPTMINLTIVLLVLVLLMFVLATVLFVMRRRRRRRLTEKEDFCGSDEKRSTKGFGYSALKTKSGPFGRRPKSLHVYQEKRILIENSSPPPSSPDCVPEIRLTLPEEHDGSGRRMSGRVVVIRVGETGVGLEPLREESSPASQSPRSERFQSIDLERIGGLKER
ncbi:MAG: hypothetical protein M1815_000085 [Lichina confinis]|nr:MAG: hypothetical protein M1815_000085 [Lichina confinis]